MKSSSSLLLFILLTCLNVNAQNLFPEKFEGCDTSRFTIEKDFEKVHAGVPEIINVIKKGLDNKTQRQIKGIIQLQVLVNTDGTSCLLSLKNETNIAIEKLNLKKVIDERLVWNKPEEMICAIISVSFRSGMIGIARLGLDTENGYHDLKPNNP